MVPVPLVGRAAELLRLDHLLSDAVKGRGAALALVGEPGIGKSALLDYLRERAGTEVQVLSATGAEAEQDLPFAGLLSLLAPVLDGLEALPEIQRRALAGALALAPPVRADPLVAHAAALALLSAAGQERPLLALVDDAHWLDDATAAALLFAARRLDGERVALVLALRPVEGRPRELSGVEQLPLAGLALPAASELLRGRRMPSGVLTRLHAATAGNPLALLETARHLPLEQLQGRDPLGDPLPVGPNVQAAFRRRLDRLPPSTRIAMLVLTAAGADPLARLADAGADLGVGLADLEPAEADELIELQPGDVRFRHPLVRAAAYRDASAPERRAVHRALAAYTEGARRANHLWAAATGPDEQAASELEAAALVARERTGFTAAALAFERAARLTAPGDARAQRLLGAAQDRLVGGDAGRAVELAREALADATSVSLRAELEGLIGATGMLAGSLDEGFRMLFAAAESIADEHPERAAWMLANAALTCFLAGRVPLGHETTVRAYEHAQRVGGRTELIVGILLAGARIISGQAYADGERALLDRWPEALDERVLVPGAPHLIGQLQFTTWLEHYDAADAFAARVEAMVAATGAVGALPLLRAGQLEIDLRRGDWARARARASEALRLGEETGQLVQRSLPLATLARLDAAMGLEDECRQAVDELLGFSLPAGLRCMNVYSEAALGLLELGLGHATRAVGHLDAAARLCAEYGQFDPSVVLLHPDRIEAHLRAGDRARAEAALAEFEAMAQRTRRPWPLACVARAHGMLEADFDPWFERAYAHHGPSPSPFELGRTELCHGERLRRARRVRAARERLRAALERFEALGAAPWAARARSELRAAGAAVAASPTSVSRALTPQELEVALAVAKGATNREVAAALYVSPKTIEVHLSRVYRKLDVRSRTELAGVIAQDR